MGVAVEICNCVYVEASKKTHTEKGKTVNLIQIPTTDLCLSCSNENSIWVFGLGLAIGVVFPKLWKHIYRLIVFILQVAIIVPVSLLFSCLFLVFPYVIFTFPFILILEFGLFLVLLLNIFNAEYRDIWWENSIISAREIPKYTSHKDYQYWLFSVPTFSWARSIVWLVLKPLKKCLESIGSTISSKDSQ